MGRLPKIRVSYYDDANFLLRLINAIERDKERPAAWRAKVIEMIRNLAQELTSAPNPKKG